MGQTSKKQLKANRKNAKLGGVKTEEGKQAIKHNALKHGILSKDIVIKTGYIQEKEEDYQSLLDEYVNYYKPEGLPEKNCVISIVNCSWRKSRLYKAEQGEIRKLNDHLKFNYENEKLRKHNSNKRQIELAKPIKLEEGFGLERVIDYQKFDPMIVLIEDMIECIDGIDAYYDIQRKDFATCFKDDDNLLFQIEYFIMSNKKKPNNKERKEQFISHLNSKIHELKKERAKAKQYEDNTLEHQALSNFMPSDDIIQKFCRYCASIDREMSEAFEQLEKLQNNRRKSEPKNKNGFVS